LRSASYNIIMLVFQHSVAIYTVNNSILSRKRWLIRQHEWYDIIFWSRVDHDYNKGLTNNTCDNNIITFLVRDKIIYIGENKILVGIWNRYFKSYFFFFSFRQIQCRYWDTMRAMWVNYLVCLYCYYTIIFKFFETHRKKIFFIL